MNLLCSMMAIFQQAGVMKGKYFNMKNKLLVFIVVVLGVVGASLIGWNYNKIEQEFKVRLDIPCFEVEELCFSWTALCYSIDNTPENDGIEENLLYKILIWVVYCFFGGG